MVTRLRSRWLAGGGAILLVMSLSGMAAAASLVSDTTDPGVTTEDPAPPTDTTITFEDVDGNGVDDDCQDAAPVAAPEAAAAALIAVDLDGDGTISTSEAAQSDWTGGTNCNHGGYVSGVAQGSEECGDAEAPAAGTDEGSDEDGESDATLASTTTTVAASCDAETETEAADEAPTECAPPVVSAPVVEAPVDTSPNAHGKAVSEVAKSDAVGGENCNHGGAVSAAAKKDHSGPHGHAAKGSHGKGKGKGHGKP
ncbi:MAG: hypothetical protein ACJ771_11965 [Chloroflexota bacterium]